MKRAMVLAGLLAAFVVVAAPFNERALQAHATCTSGACCSPHGASTSSTGFTFGNCAYNPGLSPSYPWLRDAWGAGGGCSGDACLGAKADANHNVVTSLNYCDGGTIHSGESCCLSPWSIRGMGCSDDSQCCYFCDQGTGTCDE
jgi:hypothetical protein